MKDSYVPKKDEWFSGIVSGIKNFLGGIKTQWVWFDWKEINTPPRH